MNTGLLHLRVSRCGDLLVFDSPLQNVFALLHTYRCPFKNNPHLIHWLNLSTPQGLALLRWAQETEFDFAVVSVRGEVKADVPPLLKGLKIERRDDEQGLYLPCDVLPYQLVASVPPPFTGRVYLATPWFLDQALHPETGNVPSASQLPNACTEFASTSLLPAALRDCVKDVLAWGGENFHGDFLL